MSSYQVVRSRTLATSSDLILVKNDETSECVEEIFLNLFTSTDLRRPFIEEIGLSNNNVMLTLFY